MGKNTDTQQVNTAYNVSKTTAAYIDCIKELNGLYDHIAEAFNMNLVGNDCTKVVERDVLPIVMQLGEVLHKYMVLSIDTQLSLEENNGVII